MKVWNKILFSIAFTLIQGMGWLHFYLVSVFYERPIDPVLVMVMIIFTNSIGQLIIWRL